jgi:predicted transcriptional regulator
MHRYSLEFSASALDETRLRDFLEREFQLSGIIIVRNSSTPAAVAETLNTTVSVSQPKLSTFQSTMSPLETAIVNLLADKRPWRRKRVFEEARYLASTQEIYAALRRLEASGALRKARHGVYLAADAPQPGEDEIPPMNMTTERPSYGKALELLREPKSAVQLQELLGVSRQRVDQILKVLMREGTLHRLDSSGERGSYIYVLSGSDVGLSLLTRNPKFHDSRAKLLSALSPDLVSRAADVALSAGLPLAKIGEFVDQLTARGLLIEFRLGRQRYVAITPRGLNHPQYNKHLSKASPADIVADFGETRIRFIELLSVLRAARTIDLTHAMPKGYLDEDPQNSGQIINCLEIAGVVEKIEADKGKHPKYRLTDKGKFIASIIRQIRAAPTEQHIIEAIRLRRDEEIERSRSAAKERTLSPTQASILSALRDFGCLGTKEILQKMSTKFSNQNSIHLTLKVLTKRGAVRRVRDTAHKTDLWELIEGVPTRIESRPDVA